MNTLKFFDSVEFSEGIKMSSLNEKVAAQRAHVYHEAMGNLETLQGIVRKMQMFDGLNAAENMQASQMGVALAEASLKAQINSIVGYVAIERSMTQMSQNLVYRDIITKGGASVMPMIGADYPRQRAAQTYKADITQSETSISVELGNALTPRGINITLTLGSASHSLMDDGKGNLLAAGGIISAGTVDYETGAIAITLTTGAPAESKIQIDYCVDKTQAEGNNRTTPKQGYFNITAKINKFEFEADLITAMISQKTLGGDVVADLQQSVYDEQVLSINNQLIRTLKDHYAGSTQLIDLSAFSVAGGFYSSLLQTFNAGLTRVDAALAQNTYKVIAASAYVVGNGLAALFMSMEDAQGWVANNTGYVNGIIGFYKGRAVIRHLYCDSFEGYALHKTADGQLAALGYGILLPATNLPLVGNFAATNEVASGIYAVDGTSMITTQLAQRFIVKVPADFEIIARTI